MSSTYGALLVQKEMLQERLFLVKREMKKEADILRKEVTAIKVKTGIIYSHPIYGDIEVDFQSYENPIYRRNKTSRVECIGNYNEPSDIMLNHALGLYAKPIN